MFGRVMESSFAFVAAFASLAITACRSPTQISVSVQTDFGCPALVSTSFTSGELGVIESNPPTTVSSTCDGEHLGTVVLVPSGEDDAEVGFKVVTALNGETLEKCSSAAGAHDANCIVARRALRFLPHTSLKVIVYMTKACEGQICDPDSTCVDRVCVNATIPDPSQCEGEGCTDSVLGDGAEDAGVDATLSDGSLVDAPVDVATSDAPVADAQSDAHVTTLPVVPGCDLAGLQANAPWPMESYCPSGRNRSPLAGPTSSPGHKWTYDGGIMPAPSIAADGTIYVADNASIVALDPTGGSVRWRYSAGASPEYANLPVLAADDTIRVFDYANDTYASVRFDASATVPLPIGTKTRGVVTIAGDGTLYFPSNSGDLVALNGDGTEKWSAHGYSVDQVFPSVANDGTIYTSDYVESLTALRPDGGVRWNTPLDAGELSNLIVAVDGTLRAFSSFGTVFALDATGAVIWSVPADPDGLEGIAVADDGTTYAAGAHLTTSWSPQGIMTGSIAYGCGQPTIDVSGNVYAICGGEITMFDAALSTRKWHVAIPNFASMNLGTAGVVIGPGSRLYTTINDNFAVGAIDAFGP